MADPHRHRGGIDRIAGTGTHPRVKLAALVASFAIATIGMRLALAHSPAAISTDLAQPLAVATNWHAFGAIVLGIAIGAFAIAAVAYVRSLREPPAPLAIALTCAAALVCALLAPAIFSSDPYAYAAYGEMARLGIDPYVRAPLHAGDPLFAAAIWQWGNPIPACVYGPAFVELARAAVLVASPFGVLAQLDLLRVAACAALIACVPLAYFAYPGEPRARAAAAACIALNPVAIWSAAEGHNDAIALAVALAGFALLARGAAVTGPFVVALSGAIKLPGAVAAFAPLLLGTVRARAGAVAGVAAVAIVSLPLARALEHTGQRGTYAPLVSLQAIFAPAGQTMAMIAAAIVAIALGTWAVKALRQGRSDGWPALGIAAWMLIPNPYPWYGTWLIALAALAPRSRAGVTAMLLAGVALLRYVPDAVGAPNVAQSIALGVVAIVPLCALAGIGRPAYSSSTGTFEGR